MADIFGKYELLEKVAQGGMAEVFLARQRAELGGFSREVAIKRIFPHLAEKEELVSMFLDEGRIAAGLNHPNIVQNYDLGQVDGYLYIAMEYIHGRDLNTICSRGLKEQNFLPRETSVAIVAHAAAGLHFAHTRVDAQGRPMNIVHRDISPQNILVSMDGHVKVCDFGIASAEDRLSLTQAGQFKGKYSYMCPEQVDTLPLDARSDVFNLGIVLWETTTGQRLFRGDSPLETIRMLTEGDIPRPSEVVEDYPPDLDNIVMFALAIEPENRFQSAEEFQLILEEWLLLHQGSSSPVHISRYMRSLFPELIRDSTQESQEIKAVAEEVIAEEAAASAPPAAASAPPAAASAPPAAASAPPAAASAPPAAASAPPAAASAPPAAASAPPAAASAPPARRGPPPAAARPPASGVAHEASDSAELSSPLEPPRALVEESWEPGSGKRGLKALGLALGVLLILGGIFALALNKDNVIEQQAEAERIDPSQLEEPPPVILDKVDVPFEVQTALDAKPAYVVNGLLVDPADGDVLPLVAGQPNEVMIFAPQHAPARVYVDGEATSEPVKVSLSALGEAGAGRQADLSFVTEPRGATIFLDGVEVGTTPTTVKGLSVDHEHHVSIQKEDRYGYAGLIQLVPGAENLVEADLERLDSSRKHYVEVIFGAIPRGSAVSVDGEQVGMTPFFKNYPRNAALQVQLDAPDHKVMQRRLLLEDVGTMELRPFLDEMKRRKGTVTITPVPDDATLYVGRKQYEPGPVRDLSAPEGALKVVIETAAGRDEVSVEVVPETHTDYVVRLNDGQAVASRQ